MADLLLDLQETYNKALVSEITEKTKANAILWGQVGTGIFQSQIDQNKDTCPGDDNGLNVPKDRSVLWTFQIQRVSLGVNSFRYNLDLRKDGVIWVSVDEGVKDLYDMVELITLRLDARLKETLQFVQNIDDGR